MTLRLALPLAVTASLLCQAPRPNPPAYKPTDTELNTIRTKRTALEGRVSKLRAARADAALLADVEVYQKAIDWLLRYPEEFYNKTYVTHANTVLDRGLARAADLEAGRSPWAKQTGRAGRAYRSAVDGSLQPYGVSVPAGYDGSKPVRLDVVLHGRGATLSEVSFLAQQESIKPDAIPSDRIELHVFGRTNNAYRWSGETDVFEAIESVRSRYKVDGDRTVLRGFSMGGAGTWHIGLHYPDRWLAIEAGAGFTETKTYAKQTNLPPYAERPLRIYDAVEYAHNAVNVPAVGYGGDKDPQLRASENIRERLGQENLTNLRTLFLIGPDTEHRWHPDSKKQSDAFIDRLVPAGRQIPDKISFVTYTTRYNRCFWITVDALDRHYERTEVAGKRSGRTATLSTKNVARLTVEGVDSAELDGQTVKGSSFERRGGKWVPARGPVRGKRHGLQGPIDDAFLSAFAVVEPSGQAPQAAVDRMRQFAADYPKWLRGDVPTVRDTAVTREQAAARHLVLFGDPSSNRVLGRIAAKLPVRWDKSKIQVGARSFDAASHILVMICPNPEAPDRYVVLNSGHTFGEVEFRGTNALLFPRLGDYAVLDRSGAVVHAGLFDENWKAAE
ncbi:MAG: hypothetical protein FJW39_00375 [Acidobacteria bacterium]|nr:hypothetical protein [Acidobacteriota bacterium]